MFLNINSVILRLEYKEGASIEIYAIIDLFPVAREKNHQIHVFSFKDTEEFLNKTEDIKEAGNLIGDIIYNNI